MTWKQIGTVVPAPKNLVIRLDGKPRPVSSDDALERILREERPELYKTGK